MSSSSVIIGGQDLNAWVKSLMENEDKQIDQSANVEISQLQKQQKDISTQLSAYGQVQSLLTTLQTDITALSTAFNPTYTISSTNTNVASATVSGTVTPGNHTVTVTQLASAESVASSSKASSTTSLGTTETIGFTVNGTSFTVNVAAGDALTDIANNITTAAKNSNVGVNATVVPVSGGGYQLVISGTQSGSANALNISETVTSGSALNIAAGTGGNTGTILTPAQNAVFTMDTSLSFNTASNTNIIEGMSVALVGTGSTNLTVTQTNPVTTATTAIQKVFTDYNAVMTNIAQAQGSSATPDTTLSGIQSTLQSIMQNQATTLAGFGISLNTNPTPIKITLADGQTPGTVTPTGLYNVDTSASDMQNLTTSLNNNFSAVQAALSGTNGVFTSIGTDLTTSTGSVWKMLNDTTTNGTLPNGAIPRAQTRIGQLSAKITADNTQANNLKQQLILKYAQLDMTLSTLQNTSSVLGAQLQSLSKSGG